MKQSIHPKWFEETQVSCVCGNAFTLGTTKEQLKVDVCSRCHPFFTGKMRFTTALGKVEKFESRRKKAKKMKPILAQKKAKKLGIKSDESSDPKSLKEMLLGLQ